MGATHSGPRVADHVPRGFHKRVFPLDQFEQ